MSQTTAPRREMVEGSLGLLAQPFSPEDIMSKVNPAASSFFGRLAVQGAGGDDHIEHPSAAIVSLAKEVVGIVSSTHAIVSSDDALDPSYKAKDSVNVMRKGYIYVAITVDVNVGDDVHVLIGAGSEGKFANVGGEDLTSIARWAKSGLAADGVALLEINSI